ncbi:CRISPR-associated endonuclease Cas2 [Hydrogenimonas thermophila]|uniref:CRISPR-associated endonuclease Cas2 n=1 Tax=Hydrogenimonas thermophila TaxID=223786 RepID=UPI002936F004|nr:CRISPR-associated endonuclease Cas2 [Hydrogenimonas thermophila]WOE70988.1 CRISPR-associated endonuclease Cas2 [Hydrogenimonas thermophila]WOE73506.1 CRISPR-associated endonuclease Cas2 [Hydrogenimonas thermophila]
MYLLVVYDITDDKRRRKCEKVLSSYGSRVNYSVFELEIKQKDLKKIRELLEEYSSKEEDHIRFYILNREVLIKSFVLHRNRRVFEDEELYF